MDLGESVYEFVDKYAYFACAANIILENYTVTDNEEAYKGIMIAFDKYIKYYNRVELGVKEREISNDAADAVLRTYINWLRNTCISNFLAKMQKCINEGFGGDSIKKEIKERLDDLQKKIRGSDFNTSDLLSLLTDIRIEEEKIAG